MFFVIALSVIVFVHEYGHYIVARWCGIHSEVFSIGFGPVLFSRTDKRGTRWQIAAIPFGGFVKFMGDADASSVRQADVSGLSETERRHTMAGAPLWARAATVAAGAVLQLRADVHSACWPRHRQRHTQRRAHSGQPESLSVPGPSLQKAT